MAHGRKRTIAGWSCLGASALLAAALLASSRYSLDLSWTPPTVGQDNTYVFGIQRGSIATGWIGPWPDSDNVELRRVQDFELEWWFPISTWEIDNGRTRNLGILKSLSGPLSSSGVFILIWPLILITLTPGVPLLLSGRRAARRARVGCCAACGYDRAATPREAPCPECGVAKIP